MIHQLDATLHNIYVFIEHGGIDDIENIGMRLVFCIEDGDDIAACDLQREIQSMGLVDRLIIEDDQLNVWIAQFINLSLCLRNSPWIVLATNSHDLHQLFRIVEIVDFLQGFAIDIFLMPGRQQDSKGEARIQVDSWSMIEPCMFGHLPYKEAQAYIENSLCGHHEDDEYIKCFKR